MDYIEWFHNRVAELRIQKGVSARDMSLSLGQSESYINKIENKRTLPSMTGFIYICEYLGVTPKEFFDTNDQQPIISHELHTSFIQLKPDEQILILDLVKKLSSK